MHATPVTDSGTPPVAAHPRPTAPLRFARKIWRNVRNVAVYLLPPLAFQSVRHLFWYGRPLPLRPRSFTHRLFHKMARDRNPLLVRTSDKLAVRGYVEERLGHGYLPELHAVVDSPAELLHLHLPDSYVVKATHGSGMTAIVPVDSREARARAMIQARQWLARHHWRRHGEWGYRAVPRRLIVEEFLDAGDGASPPDWKWYCFGGVARLVHVDFGRQSGHTRNFYDSNGTRLDLRLHYPPGPEITLPESFGTMREIAERLSQPFDFVRVDLYAHDNRVLVGELTHYPGAGNRSFDPPEWDEKLGAFWTASLGRSVNA